MTEMGQGLGGLESSPCQGPRNELGGPMTPPGTRADGRRCGPGAFSSTQRASQSSLLGSKGSCERHLHRLQAWGRLGEGDAWGQSVMSATRHPGPGNVYGLCTLPLQKCTVLRAQFHPPPRVPNFEREKLIKGSSFFL